MRIDAVSMYKVPLALVEPLRTSSGTHAVREAILVCAHSGGMLGWGENVALVEPFYVAEYVASSLPAMINNVIPRVVGCDDISPRVVSGLLSDLTGCEMAKYAVEMAVTDVWLRQHEQSLASYIGATQQTVPAGVVVGLYDSIDDVLGLVDRYRSQGYQRIKLKIAPHNDVEVVRAVRDRVGSDFVLQADANCSYSHDDIDHLGQLDQFHLQFIEQPFAPEHFDHHASLASQIQTPICLDESIITLSDLERAVGKGSCSFVNIKPARVGSMFTAIEMYEFCIDKGVTPWCGGMLESGIGRAALLAFAALPNFTITHDLSASHRYFDFDVTPSFDLEHGSLRVPHGPGIGVEPHKHVIEAAELLAHVTR